MMLPYRPSHSARNKQIMLNNFHILCQSAPMSPRCAIIIPFFLLLFLFHNGDISMNCRRNLLYAWLSSLAKNPMVFICVSKSPTSVPAVHHIALPEYSRISTNTASTIQLGIKFYPNSKNVKRKSPFIFHIIVHPSKKVWILENDVQILSVLNILDEIPSLALLYLIIH